MLAPLSYEHAHIEMMLAWLSPATMPSLARLEELRAECFADDLEIRDEASILCLTDPLDMSAAKGAQSRAYYLGPKAVSPRKEVRGWIGGLRPVDPPRTRRCTR